MKQYTVYFECYGRHMKTTFAAESANEAVKIVKSKINIINVEPLPDKKDDDDMLNTLKHLFNL